MRRALSTGGVLALTALWAAAPAGAATASMAGDTMAVQGDGKTDVLVVFRRQGKRYRADQSYRLYTGDRGRPRAGAGCNRIRERDFDYVVRCPALGTPPDTVKRLTIDGGPGKDLLSAVYPGFVFEENCGTCAAVSVPATLNGGDGSDSLLGGAGPTSMLGGAGNDGLLAFRSAALDGGPGTDTVAFLVGGPLAADLAAGTASGAYDFKASLTAIENLQGDTGNDKLFGDQSSNNIEGSEGSDMIDPRGGRDEVHGGEDSDAITTLDGEIDSIECGEGRDLLVADPADQVVNGCMIVERIGAASRLAGVLRTACPNATLSGRVNASGQVRFKLKALGSTPPCEATVDVVLQFPERTIPLTRLSVGDGLSTELKPRIARRQRARIAPDCFSYLRLTMTDATGNTKQVSHHWTPPGCSRD
jgi:Ca2+-binding RTX toxin-like protein